LSEPQIIMMKMMAQMGGVICVYLVYQDYLRFRKYKYLKLILLPAIKLHTPRESVCVNFPLGL